MLTKIEQAVVRELQKGLPLTHRPFDVLAQQVGLQEEELLHIVRRMQKNKVFRRFGIALSHRKVGVTANAMVVWQVPAEQVEAVGKQLAASPHVSHCYQRPAYPPDWPYNLFTMVHGSSRDECQQIVQQMAREVAVDNYQLLYSTTELKKTTMRYFTENQAPE